MYNLPVKKENSTFSTQICLKNGFRFGISKNKNQYLTYFDLKFEKTNVEIRISISETLCVFVCVYVCVCVRVHECVCVSFNFQSKQKTLTFPRQICPKMDLRLEIEKTDIGIRISILKIHCMLIFSKNR